MQRSLFVKRSVYVVSANTLIAVLATDLYPNIVQNPLYKIETALSTAIVLIGTITMYLHLKDKYYKELTLLTIGALLLAFFYVHTHSCDSMIIHICNSIFVILQYIRLLKSERLQND